MNARLADHRAQLAALRRDGAWRLDPIRFHAMESLVRRLPDQPEPVRRLLQDRLQAKLEDFSVRWTQAWQGAAAEVTRIGAADPALARQLQSLLAAGELRGLQRVAQQAEAASLAEPLALQQLNQYVSAATASMDPSGADTAVHGEPRAPAELASVRRFRQAWTRGRIADRVALAVSRPPANAGPLNSHRLLLQALDRMRELSPDYLQHFVAQAESLQWLVRAGEQYPPAPSSVPRPPRRGRAKK